MKQLVGHFKLAVFAMIIANLISIKADATETCVFQDLAAGEVCPLLATATALNFMDVGDDSVIFLESSDGSRTSVVTSGRVEDAVLLDQIDEDEGLLLQHELQGLSGARYELPKSRREVKTQLGLPDSAEVATEDWFEMIRVHAETVLSISTLASRFILEQVGLTAVSGSAPAATLVNSTPAQDAVSAGTSAAPQPSVPSDPVVVETH